MSKFKKCNICKSFQKNTLQCIMVCVITFYTRRNLMKKENLTRDYIFQAYLQLLSNQDYDDISICDICTKAGVSRMSFYRNFKSKEDLTFKGIEEITKVMEDEIKKLDNVSTYSVLKVFFEYTKKFKQPLLSFKNCEFTHTLKTLTTKKLLEEFPSDCVNRTSKYIPLFYFGSIISVLFEWLKNGCEETPEEMARFIASLINFELFQKQG